MLHGAPEAGCDEAVHGCSPMQAHYKPTGKEIAKIVHSSEAKWKVVHSGQPETAAYILSECFWSLEKVVQHSKLLETTSVTCSLVLMTSKG